MSTDQSAEARLREALAQAEDALTEFGSHSDDTRTGMALRTIAAALAATPDKPSASKRDKGWRYKWNDEKKLMEFSNE